MIKEDKEREAHVIKEVTTKNDIKEVAMDNMPKVIDQRHMESSTLVLETWVVASENQCETQERKVAVRKRRSDLLHMMGT